MVWNSDWPIGSVSVKANRTTGDQNTKYIQETMGNSIVGTNTASTRDHFWDVGTNEDGRHRFIQSVGFTVGGLADDPVIGTGMDSVLYAKETNSRVEWFHRNNSGIYQFIPSVVTGDVVINVSGTTYQDLGVSVPANVYGDIFIYTTALGRFSAVTGFFRSDGATVEAWAITNHAQGTSSAVAALKFGNGSEADLLNIRVRCDDAATGQTWHYIVTYREL